MCNRFAFDDTAEALAAIFGAEWMDGSLVLPSYNIAPQTPAAVVYNLGNRRFATRGSFGMHGDGGTFHLNARSETVVATPAFAGAFRERRAVVPATHFYEWQRRPGEKRPVPYAFTHRTAHIFCFPAVFTYWMKSTVPNFAIITGEGGDVMREIDHDRTPLILLPEQINGWLEDAEIPDPPKSEDIERWRVSQKLNASHGDGYTNTRALLNPVPDDPPLFG